MLCRLEGVAHKKARELSSHATMTGGQRTLLGHELVFYSDDVGAPVDGLCAVHCFSQLCK